MYPSLSPLNGDLRSQTAFLKDKIFGRVRGDSLIAEIIQDLRFASLLLFSQLLLGLPVEWSEIICSDPVGITYLMAAS